MLGLYAEQPLIKFYVIIFNVLFRGVLTAKHPPPTSHSLNSPPPPPPSSSSSSSSTVAVIQCSLLSVD